MTDWYIIITNPQREKKAARELRRAGLRVYLPKEAIERTRSGVTVKKHRPLWTGYLLVRFPERLTRFGWPMFGIIRNCQGVKDFVKWTAASGDRAPIPIPSRVVARYMRRQRAGDYDGAKAAEQYREEQRSKFKKGSRVRIRDGVFASFNGVVERLDGEVAHLVIALFGRETRVSVENFVHSLEALEKRDEAA